MLLSSGGTHVGYKSQSISIIRQNHYKSSSVSNVVVVRGRPHHAPLLGRGILSEAIRLDVILLAVKRSPHILIQRFDMSHHRL